MKDLKQRSSSERGVEHRPKVLGRIFFAVLIVCWGFLSPCIAASKDKEWEGPNGDRKIWKKKGAGVPEMVSENRENRVAREDKKFEDPMTGMEFVFVRGGCYRMGNPLGDGYVDEEPAHEVCLGDYYIGRFEATQGQWEKVMGGNPSVFKKGDRYPVEYMSWYETQEFIRRLNQRTGIGYRLPTEAQWEYAARSGGKREKWAGTSRDSDLDEFAWTDRNSGEQTHPVGRKKANGLGLFDMSGNVWEWLADWYDPDYYKFSPRMNPPGPDHSYDHSRVMRGGSWISSPEHVRACVRARGIPSVRGNVGFRLVFSP